MLTPTPECKRLATSFLLWKRRSRLSTTTATLHPHMLLSAGRITKSSAWNSRHLIKSQEIRMPGLFLILVSPHSSDDLLVLCGNSHSLWCIFTEPQNHRIVWIARDPSGSWSPTLKWMAHSRMEPTTLMVSEVCCNQLSQSQGIFLCLIVIYPLYHIFYSHGPMSEGKKEWLRTEGAC